MEATVKIACALFSKMEAKAKITLALFLRMEAQVALISTREGLSQ